MNCFVCGKPITNSEVNCPHCGYRFTVDDNRYCPNSRFGVCSVTENMCTKGINFQECPIKIELDRTLLF